MLRGDQQEIGTDTECSVYSWQVGGGRKRMKNERLVRWQDTQDWGQRQPLRNAKTCPRSLKISDDWLSILSSSLIFPGQCFPLSPLKNKHSTIHNTNSIVLILLLEITKRNGGAVSKKAERTVTTGSRSTNWSRWPHRSGLHWGWLERYIPCLRNPQRYQAEHWQTSTILEMGFI